MATAKAAANAQVNASGDAVDPGNIPAGEKLMYYNDAVAQHPRHHQPANPDEAKRAAEDATREAVDNDKIKPQPSAMTAPKEIVKKADEVNDEIAKRSDTP